MVMVRVRVMAKRSESKPRCYCTTTTAIALNDAVTLQETTASREHWCMGIGEELGGSRAKSKDQGTSKIEDDDNKVEHLGSGVFLST
jgi:hypothetical protein